MDLNDIGNLLDKSYVLFKEKRKDQAQSILTEVRIACLEYINSSPELSAEAYIDLLEIYTDAYSLSVELQLYPTEGADLTYAGERASIVGFLRFCQNDPKFWGNLPAATTNDVLNTLISKLEAGEHRKKELEDLKDSHK